jgi:Glycosyltransferase family 87
MSWWHNQTKPGAPRSVGPWAGLIPLLAFGGWLLLAWLSWHPPTRLVWWLLSVLALQWALTVIVLRQSPHAARGRWIVWGIAFRVVALFAFPILEDEYFRFLWDGRMFAQTGDPYATAPSDHFGDTALDPRFTAILDQINYPHVPTIYGPLMQLGFLASYLIAPAALWPWKLLLCVADVGLLAMLRKLGQGEIGQRAALFAAWCPLSIFETAFNAHPDALAVSLMTAALLARRSKRDAWLGLLCGAAISAKLFFLLLAPFLLWRRRWNAWAWAAATVLGCYLPFLVQGSLADLPGLRTFAREWEFNSSGYALLAFGLGPSFARPLVALLFAMGWMGLFYAWTRANPEGNSLPPGLLVFALFFFLSPTFNPWYALWLLPFISLRPMLTGVATLAAVSLSYITWQNLGASGLDAFGHPAWVRPVEFGLIASMLIVDLYRLRRSRNVHRAI